MSRNVTLFRQHSSEPDVESQASVRDTPQLPTAKILIDKSSYKDVELERELVRRYQAGDRFAGDRLLSMHAAIIYKYVRTRVRRSRDADNFDDLMQEARLGFLHALSKFDLSLGLRVITYAMCWVHRNVGNYQKQNKSLIRVPLTTALHARSPKGSSELRERIRHVTKVMRLDRESFDQDGFDEFGSLKELLKDDRTSPEEDFGEQEVLQRRRELFQKVETRFSMTERERALFERRLRAESPVTLSALAEDFGVTRERMRQIEGELLDRLLRFISREVSAGELRDLFGVG